MRVRNKKELDVGNVRVLKHKNMAEAGYIVEDVGIRFVQLKNIIQEILGGLKVISMMDHHYGG
jgi:hypothetical protein